MALSEFILIGVFLGLVVAIIAIWALVEIIYPPLNIPNEICKAEAKAGKEGLQGPDGIFSAGFAKDGTDGDPGNKGMDGQKGRKGEPGDPGADGEAGSTGLIGAQGILGNGGLPTNSKVGLVSRYEDSNNDSYTLTDAFSFNSTRYIVSLFANIENNSRFLLHKGETIKIGNGFVDSIPDIDETGIKMTNVAGGNFYSNIRILVCSGKGSSTSKDKSDDTVFYVSPPISRETHLLRYKLQDIDDSFGRVDIKFPIRSLKNTKEFYYFETDTDTANANQDPDTSGDIFHLLNGIGKYELVVNTFPPLPGSNRFSYRIVEYFTRDIDREFYLPKVRFPGNSGDLIYKQSGGLDTLTVSSRFDLNRVVERDYSVDPNVWVQTNKKFIELAAPSEIPRVPFENTYNGLVEENTKSRTDLDVDNYYITGGEATIEGDDVDLILDLTDTGTLPSPATTEDLTVRFVLRRHLPAIPLINFNQGQKLYIKFRLMTWAGPTEDYKLIYTYGSTYNDSLIDFNIFYSKLMFIPRYFRRNIFTVTDPSLLEIRTSSESLYQLDPTFPITIGYTTYKDNERFVMEVYPQRNVDLPGDTDYTSYFILFPLYGYKKQQH